MDLQHGEFDLDGFRFGEGHPVYASAITPGGLDWRTQDQPNPIRDGIRFGRDHADPKPLTLALTITGDTPAGARAALAAFTTAWESRDRRGPGVESVLAYGVHGETHRIYGRPRGLAGDDGDLFVLETSKSEAVFQPSSHLVFDEAFRQLPALTITPGRGGGLIFPVEFPWGATFGGRRQGVIDDGGGLRPTPDVQIEITGPIQNPVVSGPDWSIRLGTSLAHDQTVTIDARRATVLRDNGASLAGALSRHTRLADIKIPPGPSEITFEGFDPTGTARASVRWRPAITSL